MTRGQKHKALQYPMFLKKKQRGKIKGRGFADGRKKLAYTPQEKTTSPTVTTEALFLSCMIDAHKGKDVVVVGIPTASMQTDINKLIHICF